jgi:predicted acetyltransferase
MVLIRPMTTRDSRDEYVDLRFRAFGVTDAERVWADAEAAIAGDRCLAAFDDGHLVGTAVFFDMRQWWCGRAVPMAGVSGVKVAPEYRGKGVGRALMTGLTRLIAERGYPLSALYAATSPFYRSLGWERAGATYLTSVPARALTEIGTAPADFPALRRARGDDAAEVLSVLGRAHELARDSGPVTFDEGTVRRWLTAGRWAGKDRYAYLAGDGFLAYGWRDGDREMFVDKLVAVSAETTRALWSVVASHASVAETVRAQLAPADPLWWLLREGDVIRAERKWWMLRVHDAPAAIAARGFPAADIEVPLHVTDDQVPAHSGAWTLTVRSGAGSLVTGAAGAASPLRLGARGLAALYAGVPVGTVRAAGLADGGSPEADAALDSAFAATAFTIDGF